MFLPSFLPFFFALLLLLLLLQEYAIGSRRHLTIVAAQQKQHALEARLATLDATLATWPSRSLDIGVGPAFAASVAEKTNGGSLSFDWANEILDFIHVPKAGGSSVKGMLDQWADHLGCEKARHPTDVLALDPQTQASLCIIWGAVLFSIFFLSPIYTASKRSSLLLFLFLFSYRTPRSGH